VHEFSRKRLGGERGEMSNEDGKVDSAGNNPVFFRGERNEGE
jgi:hypothetical protein